MGYTGSVAELETRIDCWVSHWTTNPRHTLVPVVDQLGHGEGA
jgi:hypothetical protein